MSNEDAQVMVDWFSAGAPRTLSLTVTKWSTRLEDGCPSCVTKHLAQAIELFGNADDAVRRTATILVHRAAILLHEAQHGYPGHRYHAIGCLAEAEGYFPAADAVELRKVRIAVAKDLGLRDLGAYCGDFQPFGGDADEAWAHVSEAFMELPSSDEQNRDELRALMFGSESRAEVIQKLTKVLKNVVDTYCLPGGEL